MTQEQKGTVRTRDAQIEALCSEVYGNQHPHISDRPWLLRHLKEAEARGAEEARRVDAEGSFQSRTRDWTIACFGDEISSDRSERNHRFLEEALELVQAAGCTQAEACQLVEYVYGRPVGELAQEVGGVWVTLAALCNAQGVNMASAGEIELARVWTKVEMIRAKQAAKPKNSPLAEHTPNPANVAVLEAALKAIGDEVLEGAEPFRHAVVRILRTVGIDPLNGAEPEDPEAELRDAIITLFDGQAALENRGWDKNPDRVVLYDDERMASGKDPVDVAIRGAEQIRAALTREGGE
ncbi:hypothetical protein NKW43_13200 [Gluconobacter albidus]|uniref:hypothetical protein n=1 Tax=Gluconobacter albidus TaxID=318683 RepID=UPI0020A105E1|nr:hypothetical protein [Gluconobacter albidus]MCP1274625.1 hypothetical protein [Gluconobacter albidus]